MNYYKTNEPDVSAELLEDEVLIVNLKNGRYHSIHNTGVVFWRLLSESHSAESCIDAVAKIYSVDALPVKEDFENFVEALLADELIIETENYYIEKKSDWLNSLSGSYVKPLIETYTDMEDLVLLYS
jgi:hypothetical protein